MRRWIAFLLTLVMIVSLLAVPVVAQAQQPEADHFHVFTEADNALLEQDVFSAIEDVKVSAAKTCGGIGKMTEQDYVALIPQVIDAVEHSATYVPGTLQQNGSFLVWQTTIGMPCCYDPRMEAKLHNTENLPSTDEVAQAQARADALYEELSAVKGGWPSSIKIGLIQPYWESASNNQDSSFNNYSPSYKAAWQAFCDATGGEGMRYTLNNANVDNIASVMSQCGLVMFDSHGSTDFSNGDDSTSQANTSYLCLTTNAGVTSQDTQAQQGEFGTYYNCLSGSGYAFVNGTCIGNHMDGNAPHSFLYMGICLGMATDGMEAGLRAKGVEAVWGYSQSVSFYGDEKYVSALMANIKNGDTIKEAASKVKAQYGDWDPAYPNYTYPQCVANYVAFPIVASSEDPYPGHGNVDVVQTVNSTWTLFSQYVVNAVSNNEEWGSVEVDYNTITATPSYGYYVDGYEVLEGGANVTQNGNVFTVDPQSDCTIQINFARRDPAVVHFSVPEGVTCADLNAYVGDEIALPEPAGSPAIQTRSFHFMGWLAAPMTEDSQEAPEFLKVGATVNLTDAETTYYALYNYYVMDDVTLDGSADDKFFRVVEAPSSWAGEYVLTYNGARGLGATSDYTGSNANNRMGTKKAVKDLAEAGIVCEDDFLNNVTDDVTYVIAPADNGTYTIKMKNENQYLAMAADTDSLTVYTSSSSDKTRWNISCGANGPVLTNVKFPNRSLQYDEADQCFKCYASAKKSLTLFVKPDGEYWFTTDPQEKAVCEEHSFGEWTVTTAPTCTEAGQEKHSCTVCGFTETRPVEALGHEWNEGEVTVEATHQAAGEMTYSCTRCDAKRTEEITKLANPFEDVVEGESYFFDPVMWALDNQVTSGVDEGHYGADSICTRAQIMTFLWRASGSPEPEATESSFSDVTEGQYYYKAVLWAVEKGITAGMGNGIFGAANNCTREQAVTFLWKAKGAVEPTNKENSFSDVAEDQYYCKAVLWAVENGITAGMGDGSFGVGVPCNRAQIITFLYKAFHQVKE